MESTTITMPVEPSKPVESPWPVKLPGPVELPGPLGEGNVKISKTKNCMARRKSLTFQIDSNIAIG